MSNLSDLYPSGGLAGTQYVFVQANGTDVENAIELQAAYDLAITKVITTQNLSAPYDYPYQPTSTTLEIYDWSQTLPVLILGQSYTFNVEGVDMVGECLEQSIVYKIQFPTAFTYNGGDIRVYLPETIKSIVIAAPGNYNFENGNFIMDTDYVDLISLDGNRSVVFNGEKTIEITANNVFVKGVDVKDLEFKIGDDLSLLKVENCKGGDDSFGFSIIVPGTFINCEGGDRSFGGGISSGEATNIASGTFTNCQGGHKSFGGHGIASGTFTNCTGINKNYLFGGGGGTASGTFTNCQARTYSFGYSGTASGTFTNCQGAFARGGTASGTFTNCQGAFGGTTSGIFTNCTGTFSGSGTASGTFTNCQGAFAKGGTASGTFTNCIGGVDSFGGVHWNGTPGVLSGNLYYCRLTSGTFETVSSGGRTVLCIDGNNDQNNQ